MQRTFSMTAVLQILIYTTLYSWLLSIQEDSWVTLWRNCTPFVSKRVEFVAIRFSSGSFSQLLVTLSCHQRAPKRPHLRSHTGPVNVGIINVARPFRSSLAALAADRVEFDYHLIPSGIRRPCFRKQKRVHS